MLDLLLKIINAISNELWSKWVLIALLGSGILVFFVTKAIQRKLGLGLKRTLRAFIRNNDSDEDPGEEGNISSIQALSTALASTIGVGNIAGVGTAIALGGPGAVFFRASSSWWLCRVNYNHGSKIWCS